MIKYLLGTCFCQGLVIFYGLACKFLNNLLIFAHCSWLCRGGYPGGGGHVRIWGATVQLGVDAEGGVHHQARAGAIDHPPLLCEPWDDGPTGPSKMRRKWPQSSCSCSLKSSCVCEKGTCPAFVTCAGASFSALPSPEGCPTSQGPF